MGGRHVLSHSQGEDELTISHLFLSWSDGEGELTSALLGMTMTALLLGQSLLQAIHLVDQSEYQKYFCSAKHV